MDERTFPDTRFFVVEILLSFPMYFSQPLKIFGPPVVYLFSVAIRRLLTLPLCGKKLASGPCRAFGECVSQLCLKQPWFQAVRGKQTRDESGHKMPFHVFLWFYTLCVISSGTFCSRNQEIIHCCATQVSPGNGQIKFLMLRKK